MVLFVTNYNIPKKCFIYLEKPYIFAGNQNKSSMELNLMTDEAVELLRQLIQIPSVSREEQAAADRLQQFMEKRGIATHRDGNNVWCLSPKFDRSKPTLLLNSHIDTVKPVNGWQHNPFEATVENGRIYGLGSNDAGASVVCLLQSYRQLIQTEQPYNLIFLASCEEEVSGKNGIERILPQLPPVQVAIVGEPTGMQPAIAEKGLMVLDVTVHGRSGHAARNEGDNAIYKAIKDIEWFQQFEFPEQSPLLGPVKMTVTVIQAGTQHNVVPDQCVFTVDIRSNEKYTNEQIYECVTKHIGGTARARSFRLNSSHIPESHPLVQRMLREGRTPFGSPTLSDQALMHFPSLKIGPGDSARSHTADEYIEIAEIHHAIKLYLTLLDQLNLQEGR